MGRMTGVARRTLGWLGVTAAVLAGCDGDVSSDDGATEGTGAGGGSSTAGTGASGSGGGAWGLSVADKVDLLFVVDNSRSMADKQAFLGASVGEATRRLVNPLCIDAAGQPAGSQPTSPLDACPPGTTREFSPITDIHIGVITSSIGGHGSNACPAPVADEACGGGWHTTNDDKARLVARADACTGAAVPTYNGTGFLNWDPTAQSVPPGDGDVDNLTATLADMVTGAGQIGCGYEAPLEAMYRFLADPAPPAAITVPDHIVVKEGIDETLLAQRASFLRPDSALAIVLLSDENDCSIIEESSFYLAAHTDNQYHLPPARQECASNPNDACCASCGMPTPTGCPEDPACDGSLGHADDPPGLRCFQQKRRFGIDFLYPVQRYINALTQPTLVPTARDLAGSPGDPGVANPIFSNLGGGNEPTRGPSLVFLAGIVGVPWQLVANDPDDPLQGYKPATALDWGAILGDPEAYVPPGDAHMIESIDPRPGLPTSGNGDPVHGHDRTIAKRDDLQYACTFALPEPRDCTVTSSCDCSELDSDNPICTGPSSQTQARAKAYPGLRHLSVIQGLGAQGAVASICAYDTSDTSSPVFGYRPAMTALVDGLRPALSK
jgi:hypothetical protein